MYDAVALGELLIDFAPVASDEAGFPTLKANPGGAPSTFLATLSRYGFRTAFLGKVGQDAFGQLLARALGQAGIDTRGVVMDPSVFTTLAFVTLDEHGERSFSFARKPGADVMFRPEELELSVLDTCRLFHFGTLSLTGEPARSATRAALTRARAAGAWISCDPNLRLPLWHTPEQARREMLWAVSQADIVKISDDEVAFLWGCTPEQGAERLLCEYGVRLAMVTLGPRGCYLQNHQGAVSVPCPSVQARDTTGAGDIFGGAAASQLLSLGKDPGALAQEELAVVASFASTAASLSTQVVGGIPSIPSKAAVDAVLCQAEIQ